MSKLDDLKAAANTKTFLPGQRALFNPATGTITPLPEPEVSSSVEATLAQRGSRYGDFTDHARICQALKDVMVDTTGPSLDEFGAQLISPRGWSYLDPVKKQALEVIADKIARILSGDPNYDDNWHDIQGYAKLVEDRLPCNQKPSNQFEVAVEFHSNASS